MVRGRVLDREGGRPEIRVGDRVGGRVGGRVGDRVGGLGRWLGRDLSRRLGRGQADGRIIKTRNDLKMLNAKKSKEKKWQEFQFF